MKTSSLEAAALALKALLRRRDTRLAILALALPLSILASITAATNHLAAEAQTLATLAGRGESHYLVHSVEGLEATLDPGTVEAIRSVDGVELLVAIRAVEAKTLIDTHLVDVRVVGTDSLDNLLKLRSARLVEGEKPGETGEALVGTLLAEELGLKPGDTLELMGCCYTVTVRITGITKTAAPLDASIIVDMDTVERLTGPGASALEFRASPDAAEKVESLLPRDVAMERLGDPWSFAARIEEQLLGFLEWWALTVYVVVAATSYVVSAKLAAEAGREAGLLRTLGAGRATVLVAVVAYMGVLGLGAGLLGAARGLAGSQVASTLLWWAGVGRPLAPFLEPLDAARILALSVAASLVGGLYPAYRLSGETL